MMKDVCSANATAGDTSPTFPSPPEGAAVRARSVPQLNHSVAILPPVRPASSTHPREPERPLSAPQAQRLRPTPASIPRPPLHTPIHDSSLIGSVQKQAVAGVRRSPSELDPAKRNEMDIRLQAAEERYQRDVAAIPQSFTVEERNSRLTSLKQGSATRKSQIRKAFGVSLRLREKDKAARKLAMVGTTPLSTNRLESFRASASGTITGSVTRFSPINGRSLTSGTSPSAEHITFYHPPFRSSPLASAPSNFGASQPGPIDNPSSRGSFGAVLPRTRYGHQMPSTYASTHAAKRRHTSPSASEEAQASHHFPHDARHTGAMPYSTTYVSVPSAPAKSTVGTLNGDGEKARTKVPVAAAQAKWQALQPRNGAGSSADDTVMSESETELSQNSQPTVGMHEKVFVLSSESESDLDGSTSSLGSSPS